MLINLIVIAPFMIFCIISLYNGNETSTTLIMIYVLLNTLILSNVLDHLKKIKNKLEEED